MKKYTSPDLKDTKCEVMDIITVSNEEATFDPLKGGAHYAGNASYNWTPMEKK